MTRILAVSWWTIFQDPQLNALEDQVNVSNQNLKAAEAQFRQSRATLRYYRADYYPTVTPGHRRLGTRFLCDRPPATSTFDGITYNDFVLPFDVSYQADVWGRVRKNVESYREQAQASAADLATVNLSMHADLAVDYFQARSLDAEEQLLNTTVTQYEQALELTENRFQGGIASEVEVEQAKTNFRLRGRKRSMWVWRGRSTNTRSQFLSENRPRNSVFLRCLSPHRLRTFLLACLRSCWKDVRILQPRRGWLRLPTPRSELPKSAYYPMISLGGFGRI